MKSFDNYGMPEKVVNLVGETYSGYNGQVLHEGALSESFEITLGCMLCPMLFLIVFKSLGNSYSKPEEYLGTEAQIYEVET